MNSSFCFISYCCTNNLTILELHDNYKLMERVKFLFFCFLLIFVCSCAHVISEESLKIVDKSVKVEDIFSITEQLEGKTVLIGGMILNVKNEEKLTYIEVIEKPIDSLGYPQDTDISRGRFIIVYDGFLDSAIYSKGKYVTVVGEIGGTIVGKIEKANYKYPVIKCKEIKLVRPSDSTRQPSFHFGIGVFKGF